MPGRGRGWVVAVMCGARTAAGGPCRRPALRGGERCYAHAGGRVGRPEKLTAELRGRIVAAVRAGADFGVAARAAGVSRSTLARWRARGAGERAGPYRELHEALVRAEAECEVRQLVLINRAAEHNFRAAAWLLARRYPERWGRRPPPAAEQLPEAAEEAGGAAELDAADPQVRALLSELLRRR